MKGLIVDDHQLFSESIKLIIQTMDIEGGLEMMEATNSEQCIAILTESSDIDIILLDLMLEGLNGEALLEILQSRWEKIPVLIVTGSKDARIARSVLDNGASGFICKTDSPDEFTKAIKDILNGGVYISSKHKHFISSPNSTTKSDLITHFTTRQLEILNLMSQGHPNKIIASRLGLTEHTVKVHISNIFHKMGIHNRTACVTEAVRLGIVTLPVGS